MKPRNALPLLLSLALAGIASAQETERLYRVELIILAHLEHGREPLLEPVAGNYTAALDFLTPPPEGSEAGPVIVTTEPSTAAASANAPPTTLFELTDAADDPAFEGLDDPEACTSDVVPVSEMGPEMSEAWRRLRLSAPFRPLQYLSWQQPGAPPFPELRVHDGEVLFSEDPWAAFREADKQAVEAALVAGEELSPGPLPPPIDHYRLDGTAQLVRTRFLHLDLDLEWREAIWDAPGDRPLPAVPDAAPDEAAEPATPSAFRLYRLEQRRQVRTGRIEYFDTPVLGVLALVTDVSHLLPEPEEE